jgi:hypothetical protein
MYLGNRLVCQVSDCDNQGFVKVRMVGLEGGVKAVWVFIRRSKMILGVRGRIFNLDFF